MDESMTADVVIRNADTAMYVAKKAGKSQWREFEDWMLDESRARLELERDLRAAISEGQFELEYQPILSLHTGQATAVEALVRWNHPVRGWVDPEKFLPLLKETRLIERVGMWTLEQACRHASRLSGLPAPIDLCVNVSAIELKRHDFMEDVAAILQRTELPAHLLTLEVRETELTQEFELLNPILGELRRLGIKIAVDDFGSGYAALRNVQQFEADAVKLDPSLIGLLGESFEATAIARALIVLCATMGLQVIAEGIENDEQLVQLQTLGCDRGQGTLFTPSLPLDEALNWMAQQEHHAA